MEPDAENSSTSLQEDVKALFASEYDYLHSQDYLQKLKTKDFLMSFRQLAISIILQVSCSLDALVPYHAIYYVDKFISSQELKQDQEWFVKLLGVSCLSIALKMDESVCYSSVMSPLKEQTGLNFENEMIGRMEFQVLNALNWRMKPLTPFSYLSFFVSLFKLQEPTLTQSIKDKASVIIIRALKEISFLEFKPSLIAAAGILSASRQLASMHFPSFEAAVSSCEYVDEENLKKCYNTMQEILESDIVSGGS